VCLVSQKVLKYSQISFDEIIVEKEIGEGSYGKVFVGKWNNGKVALKFCRNKGNIENFMKECEVMM
jgi:predicted Ser/Thr protein kinase